MKENPVSPPLLCESKTESGSPKSFHCGDPCPLCKEGTLDYNGLLELQCRTCAYVIPPGAGYT